VPLTKDGYAADDLILADVLAAFLGTRWEGRWKEPRFRNQIGDDPSAPVGQTETQSPQERHTVSSSDICSSGVKRRAS